MSIVSQLAQASEDYYNYDYDYGADSTADGAAAAVVFGTMAVFFFVTFIIAYVVHALLLGMVFKKAGVPQWIAWVPFYNIWKTYELGGQAGWWTLLLLVPIVNVVAAVFFYIASYNIGLKFQKEGWFVVLAIFLPVVWLAWLAFDSSKWQDKAAPKFAAAKS